MNKDHFQLYEEILRRNNICTLATSSPGGKPEASTMLYAETEGGNLYMYCFKDTRKFPNLVENPRASIVIFNHPDYIQMDGTIKMLSKEESISARKGLIAKHGNEGDYHADPRSSYFSFIPNWIRIRIDPDFPAKYVVIKK